MRPDAPRCIGAHDWQNRSTHFAFLSRSLSPLWAEQKDCEPSSPSLTLALACDDRRGRAWHCLDDDLQSFGVQREEAGTSP